MLTCALGSSYSANEKDKAKGSQKIETVTTDTLI